MRLRLLALVVLVILGSTMVTSAQGDNKLTNGGFEDAASLHRTSRWFISHLLAQRLELLVRGCDQRPSECG